MFQEHVTLLRETDPLISTVFFFLIQQVALQLTGQNYKSL